VKMERKGLEKYKSWMKFW